MSDMCSCIYGAETCHIHPPRPATGDGELDKLLDDFAQVRNLKWYSDEAKCRASIHSYVSAAVQEAVKSAEERVQRCEAQVREMAKGGAFSLLTYKPETQCLHVARQEDIDSITTRLYLVAQIELPNPIAVPTRGETPNDHL